MSSTVIYDGCNSTEAWISSGLARLVTILAERKRKNAEHSVNYSKGDQKLQNHT